MLHTYSLCTVPFRLSSSFSPHHSSILASHLFYSILSFIVRQSVEWIFNTLCSVFSILWKRLSVDCDRREDIIVCCIHLHNLRTRLDRRGQHLTVFFPEEVATDDGEIPRKKRAQTINEDGFFELDAATYTEHVNLVYKRAFQRIEEKVKSESDRDLVRQSVTQILSTAFPAGGSLRLTVLDKWRKKYGGSRTKKRNRKTEVLDTASIPGRLSGEMGKRSPSPEKLKKWKGNALKDETAEPGRSRNNDEFSQKGIIRSGDYGTVASDPLSTCVHGITVNFHCGEAPKNARSGRCTVRLVPDKPEYLDPASMFVQKLLCTYGDRSTSTLKWVDGQVLDVLSLKLWDSAFRTPGSLVVSTEMLDFFNRARSCKLNLNLIYPPSLQHEVLKQVIVFVSENQLHWWCVRIDLVQCTAVVFDSMRKEVSHYRDTVNVSIPMGERVNWVVLFCSRNFISWVYFRFHPPPPSPPTPLMSVKFSSWESLL